MWNAEFKLYLFPAQSHYLPKLDSLGELLGEIELIGEPILNQSITRYEVGNKFLSLLTFMGCSPDIELVPQNDKPYCYIEIERFDSPRFIAGRNLKLAKCPYCKNLIKELKCLYCQNKINPEKLNWRKTAFYASSWIMIGNIYELEAIPNDNLLIALEKETGVKWKVAYIRDIKESSELIYGK